MTLDGDHKRKTALKSLLNIVMFEGVVLVAVVGAYLWSGKLTYLVGGIIGSSIIFAPMLLRWHKEYGGVFKTNAGEGQ